ncbi:MAG: AAA family ATPase [Caldisericia bacterium]|nr:AAA family ATPase [Caldisericia bacterium]
MNKELIKTVIVEYQEREIPWLIERDIDIPLESNKIIAITGPRRSGKTYLMFQIMKKLFEKNINKEQILFLSFDDPRILPIDSKGIELIFEAYRELYPDYSKRINYIFFDEIQNVKDWEIGIRRIYDTKKFRIFLTGSSSKLLSKEIATQLRGRAINYEIFPFSFKEFLKSKNIELNKKIIYTEERFKIINYLNEFVEFGGFPEVILEKNENIERIFRDNVPQGFS